MKELYQCPYNPTCKCTMYQPCRDCEYFKPTNEPTEDILNTKLSECDISIRAYNCMNAANIETLGDLAQLTRHDLVKFRNFGKRTIIEVEELMRDKGLKFKGQ